ncbi:hypothetical protein K438DRAFT_2118590 [Mycena galopus ATCC 62051]|nr:hypothetical protein K438DRAFT_2118590 [Mycena galopus ATCC 62051]
MSAWTGAAARERPYLIGRLAPLLDAACEDLRALHVGLVCSAGRNFARHYPLARVLPSLQISFAGGSSPFYFHSYPSCLRTPLLGHNTSGKLGQINFNGVMSYANAQCILDYVRAIMPVFGIKNEAHLLALRRIVLPSFYLQAENMTRGITGYGAGNGPYQYARRLPEYRVVRRRTASFSTHEGFTDRNGHELLRGRRDMDEAGVQLMRAVVEYEPKRVRGNARQ